MSLDRVSVDASRFRPFGQLGLRARIVASFTLGATLIAGLLSITSVTLSRSNLLDQRERLPAADIYRSEDEQLRRVNEYFNRRIRFAEDSAVWSQPDYWATPLETIARGAGDCEDFVLAKYFTLRELGIAEDRLRMTYVRATVGGPGSSVSQAHMVLSYYPAPDVVPLVLDNLIVDIRSATARPDLAPVFSFNIQGVFVGGASQASSPVDRVSRWRELLLRMRSEGYTP